jgi:hypothetical protein
MLALRTMHSRDECLLGVVGAEWDANLLSELAAVEHDTNLVAGGGDIQSFDDVEHKLLVFLVVVFDGAGRVDDEENVLGGAA